MAYELLGVAGLTVENKQFYDGLLIKRAIPNLVHSQHGVMRTIPARGGNSIEFRGLARIAGTTGALTEGTPGAALQVTFTNVAVTIQQYGKYVQLSDMVELQSIDPVLTEVVEMFGEQMGDTLDLVHGSVVVGGTSIQYASTAGSRAMVGSGMYLSMAEILEAVSTLERNNARRFDDGFFHAIIHPDAKRDMMADTTILDNWQEAAARGPDNPLFTGELGTIQGVKFFLSTNADIQSSAGLSGADVYRTAFMGRDYYAVVGLEAMSARSYIVPRGQGGISDPLSMIMTVGWKAATAAVRLNNNFAVILEHNTSRSTAA